MKLYRTIIAKYGGGANANDPQVFYGVAKAEAFVQALYKAGRNPPAQGLMNALLSLNTKNPFLLPGVVMKTSKTDHFVISQMQLARLNYDDISEADRAARAGTARSRGRPR